MGIRDDKIVTSPARIVVRGWYGVVLPAGARAYRIDSQNDDHALVLKLSKNGYEYRAGSGRVVTPSGKTFRFVDGKSRPGTIIARAKSLETQQAATNAETQREGHIATSAQAVRDAQAALISLGYSIGLADGVAGIKTVAAVKEMQMLNNLPPTGELDEATMSKLSFVAGTLVSEAKGMVRKPRPEGTHAAGAVEIREDGDCRRQHAQLEVSLSHSGGKAESGFELGDMLGIGNPTFFPGVEHTLVGHICLSRTDVGFDTSDKCHVALGASRSEVSGSISTSVYSDTEVIEIKSKDNDPLRFILTMDGYRYLGGHGAILIDGTMKYEWPAP
jgi:hypothetical protein